VGNPQVDKQFKSAYTQNLGDIVRTPDFKIRFLAQIAPFQTGQVLRLVSKNVNIVPSNSYHLWLKVSVWTFHENHEIATALINSHLVL
jgi:hypothetical protein